MMNLTIKRNFYSLFALLAFSSGNLHGMQATSVAEMEMGDVKQDNGEIQDAQSKKNTKDKQKEKPKDKYTINIVTDSKGKAIEAAKLNKSYQDLSKDKKNNKVNAIKDAEKGTYLMEVLAKNTKENPLDYILLNHQKVDAIAQKIGKVTAGANYILKKGTPCEKKLSFQLLIQGDENKTSKGKSISGNFAKETTLAQVLLYLAYKQDGKIDPARFGNTMKFYAADAKDNEKTAFSFTNQAVAGKKLQDLGDKTSFIFEVKTTPSDKGNKALKWFKDTFFSSNARIVGFVALVLVILGGIATPFVLPYIKGDAEEGSEE